MGQGRPTDYKAAYCEQATKLCQLGATDQELADFFEVNVASIYRWKISHPPFCEALKVGKAAADERVERSLFAKATGFEHDTVKIFNAEGVPLIVPFREKVAPDVTACIFWLKNRRPKEWRDRLEQTNIHEAGDSLTTLLTKISDGNGGKPS